MPRTRGVAALHVIVPGWAVAAPLTWFQAVVLGFLQGVTELFPISSLGHTVLFPTLFGWDGLVRAQSDPESFWLAFVVMLHVGSAIGLLIYFWRDWVEIVSAFFATLVKRRVETPTERLAWLIVIASIPTGILGLVFEHSVRVALAKPTAAAIFLVVNGVILIAAERVRRRALITARAYGDRSGSVHARELSNLSYREAAGIGVAQSTALIAGISRDGICMTTGLLRGLNNEDAARFAFLLATPIILAAGLFKLPDVTGPLGAGIRLQALCAAVCAAVAAILAVHFLLKYFKTNNLIPFGIYCIVFGLAMVIYTTV
jgi:undecaprenyl-diphosphatase